MAQETAKPADGGREFLARLAEYIRRHELFTEDEPVLVAVSGGADSVALAEGLRRLGARRLHLGHVHHGLRDDADADADFVAELARQWHLPFHLERIDTRQLARRWGASIEEAARRGRYQSLSALAERIGVAVVAVAHHADDQVETVLYRLVRGTHLRGLAGMRPRRALTRGVALVRPLLWARRRQIESFCRNAALEWRTDPTNRQTDFARNFIRHEVLPMLRRRLNPQVDEALLRVASAAGEAEAALAELAGRLFERACRRRRPGEVVLRTGPLKKAPALLATMALREALSALAAPEQEMTQQRYVELLELATSRRTALDLPGGIHAERRGQDLYISRADVDGSARPDRPAGGGSES